LCFIVLLTQCNTDPQQGGAPAEAENSAPLMEWLPPGSTGIDFANNLPEDKYRNIILYQYYYMGGGVAIGDINNDGLADVFFTGNLVPNRLFLNKGNFTFEDVTLESGLRNLTRANWCTGATMVDINHDGWLDIYVCRSGNLRPENRTNWLYINNGDMTFTERAADYGIADDGYGVQAAFFDYDRDNDLDLFIVNHGMEYYGKTEVNRNSDRDPYIADRLYRNDGGQFTDVSKAAGIIGEASSFGLGLGVADVNHDGWEDIYVANDFYEHDYLYFNNGDGTFSEVSEEALPQLSFFSMGVDIGDYNNDALNDIFVLDMAAEDHVRAKSHLAGISQDKYEDFVQKGFQHQFMFNALHLNRGNGTFSNIARLANMDETDWSWSVLLADFDNDGLKDLFVSNGLRKEVLNNDFVLNMNTTLANKNMAFAQLPDAEAEEILSRMPSEKISNYFLKNSGGLRFENVSDKWGGNQLSFSTGSAYGDLDNDGDLDLVVNNIDAPAFVYRNHASETGHSLQLTFKGPEQNPLGVGVRVQLTMPDGGTQMQQLQPTRGLQSSMQPMLHFGLGASDSIAALQVIWPDGKSQALGPLKADKRLRLQYADAGGSASFPKVNTSPLFVERPAPKGLNIAHMEKPFDDFDRERLLPHKFSNNGPVLCKADFDGNGKEDVLMGGSAGFPAQLFLQQADGTFLGTSKPFDLHKAAEDAAVLAFDADGDGDRDLWIGSGSNEFAQGDSRYQDRLYRNDGQGNFEWAEGALPQWQHPTADGVALDLEGDGDTDLLLTAGVRPSGYPKSAPPILLRNKGNGTFEPLQLPDLGNIGLLQAAAAADFDQDGDADVLLAGEWSELLFLQNNNGQLQPWNVSLAFQDWEGAGGQPLSTGWWQSLRIADLNADGLPDVVAGNWGTNYRFSASPQKPLELFAADFDGSTSLDAVLAYYQNGRCYPCFERDELQAQMNDIKRKFPTYQQYAEATMADIFTQAALDTALHYQAQLFESVVLLNKGSGAFEVRKLPPFAQISPLMDALVQDFDSDGHVDVLLVGNFYAVETQTPRLDAGKGLLLKGDGKGDFTAVPLRKSGFVADGNVKSLLLLNIEGAPCVVVGKNQGQPAFYQIKRGGQPPQ